jgi:catalase
VLGPVKSAEQRPIDVCKTWTTAASVSYDALCVLGGEQCARSLMDSAPARAWLREAFAHAKTIGALQEGIAVLARAGFGDVPLAKPNAKGVVSANGVVTAGTAAADQFGAAFVEALQRHRHFDRPLDGITD